MRAARTQRTMSNLPARPQPATFKRHATELGARSEPMSNLQPRPQPATFKRHATELGAEAASAVVPAQAKRRAGTTEEAAGAPVSAGGRRVAAASGACGGRGRCAPPARSEPCQTFNPDPNQPPSSATQPSWTRPMRAARTERTMSNLQPRPQPATFKRHASELRAARTQRTMSNLQPRPHSHATRRRQHEPQTQPGGPALAGPPGAYREAFGEVVPAPVRRPPPPARVPRPRLAPGRLGRSGG